MAKIWGSRRKAYHMRVNKDGEPSAVQHFINGNRVTYNPDDKRFYVHYGKGCVNTATFKEYRNAIYFAKRKGEKQCQDLE